MGIVMQYFGPACGIDLLVFTLFYLITSAGADIINITIGGIFEGEILRAQNAFKLAVDYINDKKLLGPGFGLEYVLNSTKHTDSFDSMQILCYQASLGVSGFVGPLTSAAVSAVLPLTDKLLLPLIAPVATNSMLDDAVSHPFLFKMSAPDSIQSLAIADLIAFFGWRNFAILTSDTEYGTHGLSQLATEATRYNWNIVSTQQFHVESKLTQIDVATQLSLIKDIGVRVIVLRSEGMYVRQVMEMAEKMNMTSPGWAWVIPDDVMNSNDTPLSMVGIIGIRPALGRGLSMEDLEAWIKTTPGRKYSSLIRNINVLESRTVDAVLTLARGLRELQIESPVNSSRLNCLLENEWHQGDALREKIAHLAVDDLSGQILFTPDQSPTNAVYDYVNFHFDGWKKVGEWNVDSRLAMTSPDLIQLSGGRRTVTDKQSVLNGRMLRVVTIEEPPFVILKKKKPSHTSYLPREEVSGLCMDLLDKLADIVGFKYELYHVRDGKYGAKETATGNWNGMVADLVSREADMAAAPLTINYIRETDIDFTRPFFDLGIGIITKKPPPEKWDPFKFTRPFTAELWYYIIGTTLIVGLYVTLLNRLSPYDMHGRFIYKEEPDQSKRVTNLREYMTFKRAKIQETHALKLGNGLWLSVACLLHQGAEMYPRAFSSRISLLVWWMGVMILIATYTANLAAHLTSNRVYEEIRSAKDLANQNKIIYGTVVDSAPLEFFNSSRVELYQSMMEFMTERRTLVASSKDGLEKVLKGGYAFLWDSAVLDFVTQQKPCGVLRSVGRQFGKSGYGFGLQKNSPYNRELSQHILALREAGVMDELVRKWYVEKSQCSPEVDSSEESGGRISVSHAVGVFLIVWFGCAAGFVVLFFEWLVASSSIVDKNDPNRPQTLTESIRLRWRKMKEDCNESCFNCPGRPRRQSDVADESNGGEEISMSHISVWKKTPVQSIPGSKFRGASPVTISISPVHLPDRELVCRDLNDIGHLTGRHPAIH